MIVELRKTIVFDVGATVLNLHAGFRVEDVHPADTILLSRDTGGGKEGRKGTGGLLVPLDSGVAEEDEVACTDVLVDATGVVVDLLTGRIIDLVVELSGSDTRDDDGRYAAEDRFDIGEGVGIHFGNRDLVANEGRTIGGRRAVADARRGRDPP